MFTIGDEQYGQLEKRTVADTPEKVDVEEMPVVRTELKMIRRRLMPKGAK